MKIRSIQFRRGFLEVTFNRTDDLNAKVGSNNALLGHMTEKYGLGDRNDNGGIFVNFCNFHRGIVEADQ